MAKPTKHYGKWRVRWTDPKGRRRSEVCDTYDDAVLLQRRRELEVLEVRRGLRSLAPVEKSFDDLVTYYLEVESVMRGQRTRAENEIVIKRHLLPAFTGKMLRDIGVAEIAGFVADHCTVSKKTGKPLAPSTVHKRLTLLGSLLRVAVDLGWLEKVPRIRKPQVRVFDKDYAYLRNDEEIWRLLHAARDEGEVVFALYATAVNTGMRAGELAGLRWSDVDFERRLIRRLLGAGGHLSLLRSPDLPMLISARENR